MFPNQWHEMPQTRNSLEDTPNKITLTHDMNLKAVITLILGLVFQFAQVLPGAVVASPCATPEVSCSCCEGPDSCPCADNGESEQKPAPLTSDSGSILKLSAAKTGDTRVSIESLFGNHPSTTMVASPVTGPSNGYAGVSLSVAFCSFVI
jgi:hypothetical protein